MYNMTQLSTDTVSSEEQMNTDELSKSTRKSTLQPGEVALVGSGPGDAELLTIRALRFIEQADVAIYDRLVSDEIMALVTR